LSKVKCSRCRREGHTVDSCICKHDADGNRLDKVDDVTYAARRARAEELKKLNVNAVQSESSATDDIASEHEHTTTDAEVCAILQTTDSDGTNTSVEESYDSEAYYSELDDGANNPDEYIDSLSTFMIDADVYRFYSQHEIGCDDDYARSLLASTRHVPAPSLLDCGDIEANPGPSHAVTPMKKMEMAAYILATCPALANNAATAAPLREWVQCSAFGCGTTQHTWALSPVPPSLMLFIFSTIIVSFVGKFLLSTANASFEQRHTHKQARTRNFQARVGPTTPLPFQFPASPPAPSLLLCGDVESNPGPTISVREEELILAQQPAIGNSHSSTPASRTVTLTASRRRPPSNSQLLKSFFSPKPADIVAAAKEIDAQPRPVAPHPDMPALLSDSDTSDSDVEAVVLNSVVQAPVAHRSHPPAH
jgi:hypothetical protein